MQGQSWTWWTWKEVEWVVRSKVETGGVRGGVRRNEFGGANGQRVHGSRVEIAGESWVKWVEEGELGGMIGAVSWVQRVRWSEVGARGWIEIFWLNGLERWRKLEWARKVLLSFPRLLKPKNTSLAKASRNSSQLVPAFVSMTVR